MSQNIELDPYGRQIKKSQRSTERKLVIAGIIALLLSVLPGIGRLFTLVWISCFVAAGISTYLKRKREQELRAKYQQELARTRYHGLMRQKQEQERQEQERRAYFQELERQKQELERQRQEQERQEQEELAAVTNSFYCDFGRYPTEKELVSYKDTYTELLDKIPDERDRINAEYFHDFGRYPTQDELNNGIDSFRKNSVERWFNTFYGRDLNRVSQAKESEAAGEMRSRNIPRSVAMEVMARDHGTCQECGQPGAELDHIIPFSKGGANTAKNLRVLCQYCNRSKGAKYEELDGA